MPKGVRKDGPRTVCRKGLHPLTPANTILEAGGTIRRCLMCRTESLQRRLRRNHKARPPETGVCMKGLHAWVSENLLEDKHGGVRCRLCRDETHRLTYARNVVIRCVVKACKRLTHRPPDSGNYICNLHRANPPEWIARLNFRIVGTRVLPTDQEPPPEPVAPLHEPTESGGLQTCARCHLVWPCYDGQILILGRQFPRHSVAKLRRMIEADQNMSTPVIRPVHAGR